MAKNDESLKEQLTNVLTTIITSQNKSIEGQNTIKQELFIFTKFNKEKLEEVEKAELLICQTLGSWIRRLKPKYQPQILCRDHQRLIIVNNIS